MSLNPDFKKIVELVKHEPKTAAETVIAERLFTDEVDCNGL